MPRSRAITTASLSMAFLAAGALAAQTGPDSTRLAPVTITAHRAPAVTGGAGVLRARLDSLPLGPAPTLDAALRRLPFVMVRTNSRGEAELSVRGSESRTPTVLLDGLPLSVGWDSRMDPSLLPLAGTSSLRISRSMTSVLAGPNAVAGTVEVDFTGAPILRSSIGVSTGIDQLGAGVLATSLAAPVAVGSGDLSVRIGASLRDRPAVARADDVVEPNAPHGERINSDLRSFDAFGSARFTGASGAYVSAGLLTNSVERGVQPELHVEEPRLWRYPTQSRVLATVGLGTGARRTALGEYRVDASAGVNKGRTEIESFEDRSYQDVASRETGDETTITSRLIAAHSLPGNATLRVGGSLAATEYVEGFNADPTTRYAQRLWSVGAEADVPVGATVALSAGLALDGARNPETGGRPPLGPRDDWAGRLGMTATVGATRLHAAASQRSRFPALRELYSGALGRFQPNPNLRPERLTTIESGATHTRGALELQGVLFRQVNEDGIVRTTLPDRKFFRVNKDEIRSTGVESVATWSAGDVSIVADLLLQRVRVFDITDGNAERRAEHVPELRATFGITVPAIAQVRANAWVTHTGTQYCAHPDTDAQVQLGSGTRLDAGFDRAWSVTRGWFRELHATVAVDNIADTAIYDQCGMPQPGRTLRAGVSLR